MTIEKLPSGSYRIRQMKDGKRISLVLPYKPTKKEAQQLLMEKASGKTAAKKTFGECAAEYIDGKRHTISPSTVRGYESILRNLPDELTAKPIGELTAWNVQTYIDSLSARGLSPKTIRNHSGFISAVFSVFSPETNISATLPQKVENEPYMPTDDEVKRILDMAKGTVYEIPLRLACYGLRRSEICALTPSDLDGCMVHINKAKVSDGTGNWVIKTTKTTSSTRTVLIDADLARLIQDTGVVYEGYPNRIYWFLRKCQDKLGIEQFPLHALRHYYASTMHALGVSDADIMEAGGWKTDHVMKAVYRHAKNVEDAQRKMAEFMAKSHGQI